MRAQVHCLRLAEARSECTAAGRTTGSSDPRSASGRQTQRGACARWEPSPLKFRCWIRPPENIESLDAALRQLGRYDWLILTSANAVRALADRAATLGIALAQTPRLQVAAVGEATAAEARMSGLHVAFVPENYVAESLVEGLLQSLQISSQRILLARATVARDVIPDALRTAGAMVDVVDAYCNVLPEAAPEQFTPGS